MPLSVLAAPPGPSPRGARLGAAGVAALALLASCATYPDRTRDASRDFERGHLARAADTYADPDTTGSLFLAGAESGTVALAMGDWERALAGFAEAADVARDAERAALLSPESLGEMLVQWTLSEGARPYVGEGYERVMLHASAAMAYLARGALESALVEVRLADDLLTGEEQLYEKEYRAGGLGHFLSALCYELEGQLDEAYIDYERMAEKELGLALAGPALLRLAEQLGRADEVARWRERFGEAPQRPPDAASVVIVAGIGLGPRKEEASLLLPTPDGLLRWSVPTFVPRPQPVGDLELTTRGSTSRVRTVVVEDLARVARENLEDRIAWLAARSTVRTFLKRELTKELEDRFDLLGRIAGDLFTLATERADLRCWSTLPDTWQAARAFLPPGEHELVLSARGGERVELGRFRLEPGETLLVFARTIGGALHAHAVGGEPVASEPQAVPAAHVTLTEPPPASLP